MKTLNLLSWPSLLIAGLIWSMSPSAQAMSLTNKKIMVSVGDFIQNDSKIWKRETCKDIHKLANSLIDNGADVLCREFNTDQFLDPELAKARDHFDYHLRITRNRDSSIGIDVTNWNRIHESDFQTLGWSLAKKEGSKVKIEDAFARVIGNFFLYANNELAYKAGLLVSGISESDEVAFDQKAGLFRDKLTNQPLSINKAVALYEGESTRKKNYLRTGIEIGVQLSVASYIYWKNLVYNQVDFDYSLKEGLKGKLLTFEAHKFDDNDKFANYGHVYAGVMYYQTARANGFNSLESALITFASSAAWELLEYHEVFSINDQILTPIGGYVIGEATYQISCALFSKNSVAAKTLGYIYNPNMGYNHAIDKAFNNDKFAGQPDCKKPRWSQISAYVGLDKGQKAYETSQNKDFTFGLDAEVVNFENYGKEGTSAGLVLDTPLSKMLIETNGNQGLIDLKVIAQVTMAAYRQRNISKDDKGMLSGYDVHFGVGAASTHYDRGGSEKNGNEDFYGTINILGATAHANIFKNGFNIRVDFGIYGDLAMVKSYSLSKFQESRGGNLTDQSGIIQKRGSYFGAGMSAIAAISISKGRFEVGYFGQHSGARSINERNRIEATANTTFRDQFHHNKVYIKFALTKTLSLQLAREYNIRSGSVDRDFKTKGVETRTTGTLVYKF
jgi:hypothetical protein